MNRSVPGNGSLCQFSGKVWFLKKDPMVGTERRPVVPVIVIRELQKEKDKELTISKEVESEGRLSVAKFEATQMILKLSIRLSAPDKVRMSSMELT